MASAAMAYQSAGIGWVTSCRSLWLDRASEQPNEAHSAAPSSLVAIMQSVDYDCDHQWDLEQAQFSNRKSLRVLQPVLCLPCVA